MSDDENIVDSEWEEGLERAASGGASSVTSVRMFACPHADCSKFFGKRNRLDRHLAQVHSDERPFACAEPGCSAAFKRRDRLKQHVASMHENVFFECPDCPKKYVTKQKLSAHRLKQHSDDDNDGGRRAKLKCEVCGEAFAKKSWLHAHVSRVHEGQPLPHACQRCTKRFAFPSQLRRHVARHHAPKDAAPARKFECPHCPEVVPTFSGLRKHVSAMHAKSKTCPECGLELSSRSCLNSHMKTHATQRQLFTCPHADCGRSYSHLRNLTQHIRGRHSDPESYKCTFRDCGANLASYRRLKRHSELHEQHGLDVGSAVAREKRARLRASGRKVAPRKDKGSARKSMAELLSNVPAEKVPREESQRLLRDEPQRVDAAEIQAILDRDPQLRTDLMAGFEEDEVTLLASAEICQKKYSNVKKVAEAEMRQLNYILNL